MFVKSGATLDSRANAICRDCGLQGRVIWFDADANLWELSTRDGVRETVAKCRAAGINTIIVDVKPLSGFVLYKSAIAPRLTESEGRAYPGDYDLLAAAVEEGHEAGIAVYAAVNVFSEGSQKLGRGPAFEHPEWQCEEYSLDARKRVCRVGESQAVHNAVFVNPLNPEVRAYELNIIREICEGYPVDGIVPDRMRYPNIYSDFSNLTKSAFETFIGRPVENWPEDVYVRDPVPDSPVQRGPLFKEWLRFRAQVIREFLSEARQVVKSARPKAQLGIYVGSWYPLYYDVGVNWGSPENCADYDWWPEGYEKTGYADLVDFMCTGCYYTHPTREEAKSHGDEEWQSVEAAAEESITAVRDATFVYGSLYLLQYQGSPERFRRAVEQCLAKTQGCMIFDLVYVRDYDWWNILKDTFGKPAKPPHTVAEAQQALRG